MIRLLAPVMALAIWATGLSAQTFPSRSETPVTDDADMIPAVEEARLAERLVQIRQDTGTELEVVTLISSAYYTGGEDLSDYAAMLADQWDLGDQTQDKAALIVVLQEDRELHIWADSAFGDKTEDIQAVVNEAIVPQFREENFVAGIVNGVEAMVTRVISPAEAAEAQTEPETTEPAAEGEEEGGGGGLWWLLALIGVPVAGFVALNRRSAAKLAATPCESCGKTGLTRERVTLSEATTKSEGKGETRLTCPSCGHVKATPYTIPKKSEPKPQAKKNETGAGGSW